MPNQLSHVALAEVVNTVQFYKLPEANKEQNKVAGQNSPGRRHIKIGKMAGGTKLWASQIRAVTDRSDEKQWWQGTALRHAMFNLACILPKVQLVRPDLLLRAVK